MNWKAVLVVLFAPLLGAVVHAVQSAITWLSFETPGSAFSVAFRALPFGWIYGLVLTLVVGLPVGFAVAWGLRKNVVESLAAYATAGAVAAFSISMLLPARTEFWLAITCTGFLLGVGYWKTVRGNRSVNV